MRVLTHNEQVQGKLLANIDTYSRGRAIVLQTATGIYVKLPNGLSFPINQAFIKRWFKSGYAIPLQEN